MERLDPTLLAEAILTAPGWARVGLTAPSAWLREDAAAEIAHAIIDALASPPHAEADQLGLTL